MKFSILLGFALGVSALPSPVLVEPDVSVHRRAICTPASGSPTDDTPAIKAAITSCGNGGTIVIPQGTTYYLNTMLEFTGCVNCDLQIEGTLKMNGDTYYWEGKAGHLYLKNINGAKIRSLTGNGVIDGNGQNAYDRWATGSFKRPTMIYIEGGSNILVSKIFLKNPPNAFNGVKGATSVTYSSMTMTAKSKSTNVPKNTDGFDVTGSTWVTIKDVDVTNQDDCVAIKPGANYVDVQNIKCTDSHGLVIGSLGKDNPDVVKNIYFKNAVMVNSGKAGGIKTYPGGFSTSTVTNVTFENISVQGCDYGIQIQSCYGQTASYCAAHPNTAVLSQIKFKNFTGITNGKQDPATSNINCGAAGTCDIQISGYNVKSPNGNGVVLCANTPSNLGVACTSGAFDKL
ncbi:Exopolygalacturonase [Dactylellina cionopaga]|nr:Exopolygalacturonase [Dactylellina cionopaga]